MAFLEVLADGGVILLQQFWLMFKPLKLPFQPALGYSSVRG